MPELIVDFITSLDGYASAEGWPGWWGFEGPEYLRWLEEQPERDSVLLMGAKTYRAMSGLAAQAEGSPGTKSDEDATFDALGAMPKIVFSSTLSAPLSWANSELVSANAVTAVSAMKREGSRPMKTVGSISLCRSLLEAGLVDRFRVVIFPVVTGISGRERIYDGYPDVALEMTNSHTFDGRIQLVEYVPTVLDGPPEQR